MPAVKTKTPKKQAPALEPASFEDILNKSKNVINSRKPQDLFTEQTQQSDGSSVTKSNITSVANFMTAMKKLADKEIEEETAKKVYKPILFRAVL
ncbi:MAG: hypothetical protein LBU89_07585 [Fibromonadaceae bacterium]|jgi:hypothetical protein|nr:hypothetical protein [Fibromonadaceae bacterium]